VAGKPADAVGKQARAELRKGRKPNNGEGQSGTKVARRRGHASWIGVTTARGTPSMQLLERRVC